MISLNGMIFILFQFKLDQLALQYPIYFFSLPVSLSPSPYSPGAGLLLRRGGRCNIAERLPDLARDGNGEKLWTQKSVFPMSVTLSVWERVCVRVRERVCLWERKNAGLFLIGCLHPWPLLLSWGCLAWRSRWFWVNKEQLDWCIINTDSLWREMRTPTPHLLRSCPPTGSIELAPSTAWLWRSHWRKREIMSGKARCPSQSLI